MPFHQLIGIAVVLDVAMDFVGAHQPGDNETLVGISLNTALPVAGRLQHDLGPGPVKECGIAGGTRVPVNTIGNIRADMLLPAFPSGFATRNRAVPRVVRPFATKSVGVFTCILKEVVPVL